MFGKEYVGYKGQDALDKLMQEKQGFVKGAFTRLEVGGIDIAWGEGKQGLQHIIKRRAEQGVDGVAVIRQIPEIIEKGEFKEDRGGFVIDYEDNE